MFMEGSMGKKWYESKTLWLNLASLLGAAGGYFTGAVGPDVALTGGMSALVNIVLRFLTKAPIES